MEISIRYSDHLRAGAQQLTGKRGSENVRMLLLGAAASALEESDYRDLTVADLYKAVGISRATFYLHFSSKDDLLAELAKGLSEFELRLMPSLANERTAWDGIYKLIQWRIEFLHENLFLTEACAALSDTSRNVNETWYESADSRRRRFVNELCRFDEIAKLDGDFLHSTVDVIGRGLTGLLYSLEGRRSNWSSESKRLTRDELPLFFSTMIYRALVGSDPDTSTVVRFTRPSDT